MKIYSLIGLFTLLSTQYVASQSLASVVSIKVTDRTKESFRIQWEQPEEVMYDKFTVSATKVDGTPITASEETEMSRTYEELTPGGRYLVSIQGFTADGEGSDIVKYDVFTVPGEIANLKLEAVDEIEIKISIMGMEMVHTATVVGIEVEWDSAQDGFEGYDVTISPNDGIVLNEPKQDESVPTKAVFTGLTPGEMYAVSVVAYTGTAYARIRGEPVTLSIRLPPAEPLVVEAHDITQTSVELKTHLPVVGISDSLHFEIDPEQYVVGSPVPNRIYSMFDMYKVHELLPGTTYQVNTYAVSDGVQGTKPFALQFTTVPNSPVIHLYNFEETSITLRWRHPHAFRQDDEVSYMLQYVDVMTGKVEQAPVNKLDITKEVEVKISQLTPGAYYEFSVITHVNGMRSSKQSPLGQGTMPMPPKVKEFTKLGDEKYMIVFEKSEGYCPEVRAFSSPSFADSEPQVAAIGEAITLSGIPSNKHYVIQARCVSNMIESRELTFSVDEMLARRGKGPHDEGENVPVAKLPCLGLMRMEKEKPEIVIVPDSCCSFIPYSSALAECCGVEGTLIRRNGMHLCCGEKKYNKRFEKCCSDFRVVGIKDECDA